MIAIHDLNKTYDTHRVLCDVSLEIPNHCLFALLGPNGSGKTTILKSILGNVLPQKGSRILVDGRDVVGAHAYKYLIGYMPQATRYPPHLRVDELIALLTRLRKQPTPLLDRLVGELQIGPFWKKKLGALSGGMAQKVNILQCFMFEPRVAVLDEPTQSLDPQVTYAVKQFLREYKSGGKTIVFTSHVMSEVEELADLMALLVEGRVYTVISPQQLMQDNAAASLEAALQKFWKNEST